MPRAPMDPRKKCKHKFTFQGSFQNRKVYWCPCGTLKTAEYSTTGNLIGSSYQLPRHTRKKKGK